ESYAELSMPYVLKWFEARIKMVQLAECMNMDALPPAPEKKSSPMRLQEKRKEKIIAKRERTSMLRKQAFRADDKIALARLKAEKILEADAALDSVRLDPEAAELLRTELVQSILDDGREGQNGKLGTIL